MKTYRVFKRPKEANKSSERFLMLFEDRSLKRKNIKKKEQFKLQMSKKLELCICMYKEKKNTNMKTQETDVINLTKIKNQLCSKE